MSVSTIADTLSTLKTRRSCRAYKPDYLEEDKLNAILQAGIYAAAMGMDIDPFYGAPELLVVLANKAMPTYRAKRARPSSRSSASRAIMRASAT